MPADFPEQGGIYQQCGQRRFAGAHVSTLHGLMRGDRQVTAGSQTGEDASTLTSLLHVRSQFLV